METVKPSNRKQWSKILFYTLLALMGMMLMTFFATMVSDWLYILFCWGDILLFSALPLILLALVANDNVPKIKYEWQYMPWALVGGGSLLLLFAILPTYYEGTERMYQLACFGPMFFGGGFVLAWRMQRSTLILIACFVFPFVWSYLFPNSVLATIFTLVTIAGSFVFVFWWDKVAPPKRDESEPLRIEDILSDPDSMMQWLKDSAHQDDGADVWFEETPKTDDSRRYGLTVLFMVVFLAFVLLIIMVTLV